MFKLLSGILSKNGDRKDRSLVRGRSARHPWSLVRLLGRYDAATTTVDNVRHWAAADGLSASAANSPEVRRTLRNRSRYEIANNSYARGISLTLANDCVGTGPRLQMLTADAFANRFVEQEFFAWADAVGLALVERGHTLVELLLLGGDAREAHPVAPDREERGGEDEHKHKKERDRRHAGSFGWPTAYLGALYHAGLRPAPDFSGASTRTAIPGALPGTSSFPGASPRTPISGNRAGSP